MTLFARRSMAVAIFGLLAVAGKSPAADGTFRVAVRVDFGQDVGQNFGTLFEARSPEGELVAGAGFLGAYNTQARSDRSLVHFFVKPTRDDSFAPQRMPRVNQDAGTYFFGYRGQLFSYGRGGHDTNARRWAESSRAWQIEQDTPPLSVGVGAGRMTATARGVQFNGATILSPNNADAQLGAVYYANGFVVFRQFDPTANPPRNMLAAQRWTIGASAADALRKEHALPLRSPGEFPYAFGQLGEQVLVATNTGGVYLFDANGWKCLFEPDLKVSFQIYSMLNFGNRLLMGQYPTGELFAYDGNSLFHLPGSPPAIDGVHKAAREAQTLTIYGGALYAGVWPWAEVWKIRGENLDWEFQGRMFDHPDLTDATVHPYEIEVGAESSVANLLGQRVTSMTPLGTDLFIATSAKANTPLGKRFQFLSDAARRDYGAVYRWRQAGCLAQPMTWSDQPTTIELEVRSHQIVAKQDGRVIGRAPAPLDAVERCKTATWRFGGGLFGMFRGKIIEHRVATRDKSDDRKRNAK